MADTITKEKRSQNMSAIKSKNTKPEVYLCKLLFKQGYRYRKHSKKIVGHPDIWMQKYNTAIFVNGCFWHRHKNCVFAYNPKSHEDFWTEKFLKNLYRDQQTYEALKTNGIKCLVVWECTIKKMMKDNQKENETIGEIVEFLNKNNEFLEI